MIHKLTIPLYHEEICPRFDLAPEVLFLLITKGNVIEEKRTIALPRPSADDLCHMLLSEKINTLICGAIEDEYFQFLKWKKIKIYDSVCGNWSKAFHLWSKKKLTSGAILSRRMVEGKYV
ncbi:NifB/NifX family molybdenum-iron cluster-binding protein [Desulfospira joergensenii]|uniref:NifB/NifX family molybdenum-iron cluster-binding protein n=1 Tax=Desulfospira joergensenii TaxID=53329 RepID=UPI0003B78090|nr:hypothetical protein [Desulfospira joergensenii]